jgi:hypothetical protein
LIFIDLLAACRFDAIVETGSFRGTTTAFMAVNSHLPVYSSEISPVCYAYCRRRLRNIANVKVFLQESGVFLRNLDLPADRRIFFYLDAHGMPANTVSQDQKGELPLRRELDWILVRYPHCVAMIDDFEVPGDSGYGVADYGAGKRLDLATFPLDRDARVAAYFPARPSALDSGARRGCIVLATPSLSARLDSMPALRRATSLPRTARS